MDCRAVLTDPLRWEAADEATRRRCLQEALAAALSDRAEVEEARVEWGPPGRPYDLVAAVVTDVGVLRAAFWSQARAEIFGDPSVHPANRQALAPGPSLERAVADLRRRLAVPARLESRGLVLRWEVAPGVERVWAAERSRWRGHATVTREDRIAEPGEADLPTLLRERYAGPALRVVAEDGGHVFFLPEQADPDAGPLVSLCAACQRWAEGPQERCPHCGGPVDVRLAIRPPRR